MPSPEMMLLESASGVFWATLISFLVLAVVGSFIWMIKKVLDSSASFNAQILEQNAAFNAQILRKMDDIVAGMTDYKNSTCSELEKHDNQAKTILSTQIETLTTLRNRPCVAGNAR